MVKLVQKFGLLKSNAELWIELEKILDECDKKSIIRCKEYLKEALKNIADTIREKKIMAKDYVISSINPLVQRYFGQLEGGSPDRDPEQYIMAFNGWTLITADFGSPDTFLYLQRKVVAWEDSYKLHYGECKEDNPYLWEYMEKYVGSMASIFQGMRIDNCHSTPLHVLEYFVNYARSITPSIYIFAELFTRSREDDAMYTRRIGLYSLIRETIYVNFP